MKRVVVTPELVRTLIHYDPLTGVMTWRVRTAELYMEQVPGLRPEQALDRAERFNYTWSGLPVGTDMVYKSTLRRIRFSFGPGVTPVRKNAVVVAWMAGSGREPAPGKEVITWDGDSHNLRAANVVQTTIQVRRILENPAAGLRERISGGWTWVLRHETVQLRGSGECYDTQQEAREARDRKLTELGLSDVTRLSDVINGND